MADETELLEAEVKVRNLETAVLQARLDQARARKRIEALEADITRTEASLVEQKRHLENLKNV